MQQYLKKSRKAFILLVFLAAITLLSGCSDNATLMHIPGDASWVAYADLRKLAIQSFSLQDILKGKTMEKPSDKDKTSGKIKWEESGIDVLSKVVIFEKPRDEFGSSLMFLIPVSDREDFQNFCEKNWNLKPLQNPGPDWLSNDTITLFLVDKMAIGIYSAEKIPAEIIRSQIELVHNLKEEDNLLKKSEWFSKLTGEEKTVALWADLGKMMDESAALIQADFLRGELCGSLDFQTGQMIADAKIMQPESNKTGSITGKPLGADLINSCVAGNTSQTFLALSLSLKNLLAAADQNPMTQGGNIFLAAYGLNKEDLEKELSGEFALHSVSGNEADSSGQTGIRLLIGTNNKPDVLLEKLSRAGQIIPGEKGNYQISGASGYILFSKEKNIEIAPEWYTPAKTENRDAGRFALESPSFLAGRISLSDLENNNMLKNDADLRELSRIWKSIRFRAGNPEPEITGMNLSMECTDSGHSSLLALLETIRISNRRKQDAKKDIMPFPPVF